MGLVPLSLRQLSTLSAVLLAVLCVAIAHAASATKWSLLTEDHVGEGVVEVDTVRAVREIPVKPETVAAVLAKRDSAVPTFKLRVPHHWTGRTEREGIPLLKTQLREAFGTTFPKGPEGSLAGQQWVFYADVDGRVLAGMDRPSVFFYRVHGRWALYADEKLLIEADNELQNVSVPLPVSTGPVLRLTWVLKNRLSDELIGLDGLHGLTIRSAREASWAQVMLPLQSNLPKLIGSIAFLCFTLVSLVLAGSVSRFDDLWAFSAFCASMFATIWIETPYYQQSFDMMDPKLIVIEIARNAIFGAMTFTGACLTIAFFRLRGKERRVLVTGTALAAAAINAFYWPTRSDLSASTIEIWSTRAHFYALIVSQIVCAGVGVRTLVRQMRHFRAEGLDAMLVPMRRRYAEAATYLTSLALMIFAFSKFMMTGAQYTGSELSLIFGVVPAAVMMVQFYWMIGASDRFRQRMLPQLDYLDYLVDQIGTPALARSYMGVLARFDLRGFKSITRLKIKSPTHANAVNDLVATMRRDLEQLVARDRTVFRFKSNGDEQIWTLFSKDEPAATALLLAVTYDWRDSAARLLARWKDTFLATAGAAADEVDRRLVADLDVHVMLCVLRDLRIDGVDDRSRPDYICDSFTLLTEAFKTSLHDRVAMYRVEAEAIIPHLSGPVRFVPAKEDTSTGFLAWDADDAGQMKDAS